MEERVITKREIIILGVILGVLTLIALFLLFLVYAEYQVYKEENRDYVNVLMSIGQSGCDFAYAGNGTYWIYDCKWQKVDAVAYGCGYLENGSARQDCRG